MLQISTNSRDFMAKNTTFSTKIGLIAATVGSAVGLGNVWRFPAEAQENGGAAFIMLYILCVFILGLPVMIGEFSLGRAGRGDAVSSFKNLKASKGWWFVGGIGILASYMILCFYMVVAGWTLLYLWESVNGGLFESVPSATGLAERFTFKMNEYICDPFTPLTFVYIMIALNLIILIGGVRKGIERLSNILMPMLFVILVFFVIVSSTLPGAAAGYEYFLLPDFSKVTPSTIISALGQAFFSLSLGMGILITYASYFPAKTELGKTAVSVSCLDLLVSMMMGLTIFPVIMSFGMAGESIRGATLVFVTLPEVFASIPGAAVWSALFFLLLAVAALTSTISIAEVSIAFIIDTLKVSRLKACLIVLLPLICFSTICSLSQGPLSDVTFMGLNIFDLLDTVASNYLLPIASFGLCVYLGWFAPKGLIKQQMSNGGKLKTQTVGLVMFLIRFVVPFLILTVLASNFF